MPDLDVRIVIRNDWEETSRKPVVLLDFQHCLGSLGCDPRVFRISP